MQKNELVNVEDAKHALDIIKDAKRAGIGSALTPRWFDVAYAILAGLMIGAIAARNIDLVALALAGIWVIRAIHRRKSRAKITIAPSSTTDILALLGFGTFTLVFIAGSRFLADKYDVTWVPIIAGALAAFIFYFLGESARRNYGKKIMVGTCDEKK